MVTEEDVRRVCLSLPSVQEKPYERLPGFRVKDRLFARIRQRPDALLVWRPDVFDKEALIASQPDKFFQTAHYEGHPGVLVRMEAIDLEELEDLLVLSWTLNAPAKLVTSFQASGLVPD